MTKSIRGGRVLIDWSQNNQVKTTVCAYSLRAREQPTVSTPVTWREVTACEHSGDPDKLRFTSDQVLARIAPPRRPVRRSGDAPAVAAVDWLRRRWTAAAGVHGIIAP